MALPPQTQPRSPEHLHALIDMGSNGIRFSISDLSPPTARILPTIYQHRVPISLYDAQYHPTTGERQPIDDETIQNVCSSFKRFQRTCQDFQVPEKNVTVLATEATRTAINSEEFRGQIRAATGWEVQMLGKEDEGRVGAMGVRSSLPDLEGLVMDLGGGSTQLSWIGKEEEEEEEEEEKKEEVRGSVSLPYGAAAMGKRLAEAEKEGPGGVEKLKREIAAAVKDAYSALKVPSEMEAQAQARGGFTLHLSGGGFRGWGYVLMSQHRISPYPIPVINGFKVSREEFLGVEQVKAKAREALEGSDGGDKELFRISERRASQVPAVAMLVNVLAEALPLIKEVRFCQGGVREGYLFSSLEEEVKEDAPLLVAVKPFEPPSATLLMYLLMSAYPVGSTQNAIDDFKSIFNMDLLKAFTSLMYYHGSHSKDLQASAALRSTTSGLLAGVHGVLHEDRALLALLLCARWGGSGALPPTDLPFHQSLEALIESPWTLWWINYLGAVAALIAEVYPAGFVIANSYLARLRFHARWTVDEKRRPVLELVMAKDEESDVREQVKGVEKIGKRKRWIGGREGVGHRTRVVENSGWWTIDMCLPPF